MKKVFSVILAVAMLTQLTMPTFAFSLFKKEVVEEVDESYIGKVITVEAQEGEFEVKNSTGRSLKLREGSKLYNGYKVYTEDGYVWVALDDNGVLKMDLDTEIKIKKDGDSLEVFLVEGEVFFNISERFEEDTKFSITTSTMTTGIRGTSGIVSTRLREDNTTEYQIKLLEGDVELGYLVEKATDKHLAVELSAGRTFWLENNSNNEKDEDGEIEYNSYLSDFGSSDVNGFAAVEIKEDEALQDKLLEADNGIDEVVLEEIIGTAEEKLANEEKENKELSSEIENSQQEAVEILTPLAQPENEKEETTSSSVTIGSSANSVVQTNSDSSSNSSVSSSSVANSSSSESTSSDISSSSSSQPVVDIIVSYYNGSVLFTKQEITSEDTPAKPLLIPSASGYWSTEIEGTEFYFDDTFNEDTSLYWVAK